MLRNIGIGGVLGFVFLLSGLGLIAYVDPLIAAGIAGVLLGLALVVRDLVTSALAAFGFGGIV